MAKFVSFRKGRPSSIGKMWNFLFSSDGLAKRVIIPALVIALVMPFLLSSKLHDGRQRAAQPLPTKPAVQIASDIAITSPLDGDVVSTNSQIRLTALINPTIVISSMSFLVNGRAVCTYSQSQSPCYWVVPPDEGDYIITAVVTSSTKDVITSSEIRLKAVKK